MQLLEVGGGMTGDLLKWIEGLTNKPYVLYVKNWKFLWFVHKERRSNILTLNLSALFELCNYWPTQFVHLGSAEVFGKCWFECQSRQRKIHNFSESCSGKYEHVNLPLTKQLIIFTLNLTTTGDEHLGHALPIDKLSSWKLWAYRLVKFVERKMGGIQNVLASTGKA